MGPDDYDGSFPLSGDPVASLAIARRPIDGPKIRSIIFKSMVEPPGQCGPGTLMAPQMFVFPPGTNLQYDVELTDSVKHVFAFTVIDAPVPPDVGTFFFQLAMGPASWNWGYSSQFYPFNGYRIIGPGPVDLVITIHPEAGQDLRCVFDRSAAPPRFALEIDGDEKIFQFLHGDPTCGWNAQMFRSPNDDTYELSDVLWSIEP